MQALGRTNVADDAGAASGLGVQHLGLVRLAVRVLQGRPGSISGHRMTLPLRLAA